MKIHLAQIPEEGLPLALRLELDAMGRLGEVIGTQSGQVLAEVRIKNREGNVEVTGRLRTTLRPPCQRCLEPVTLELDEPVRVALAPELSYDDAPEDAHLSLGDLEVSFYADEVLDLSHIVEDELLLLIPEPVADEDEQGRCTVCGRRTDEIFPDEQEGDHPFAQLKRLLNTD
jgi:uncharacterized protein